MYRILFFSGVLFGSVFSLTVNNSATNQTLLNTTVITNSNASIVQSENKTVIEPVNQVSAPPSNGREGVVSHSAHPEVLLNRTTTTEIPMVKPINTTTITLNETVTKNVSVTVAPSKISARKGVTLPESLKTGPVTVVKKPTITENAEDDYKQPDTKSIKNNNMNVLVPDSKEHKRAAYLIPIIAVIFSVPLVAAIISVLYKRGSEWWQHRHYRRMDFLIEGMYNN